MESNSSFLWHLPGELHRSCPLAELPAALQGRNCGLRQPTAAVTVRPHLLTERQLRGSPRMPSAQGQNWGPCEAGPLVWLPCPRISPAGSSWDSSDGGEAQGAPR